MSTVTQTKVDPTSVPTPAAGKTAQLVDLAGIRRLKQDDGGVTPDDPNVSTSIEPGTPSTPIPITGDAGTVGDVLTKTTDAGNGEVGMVNPRISGVSRNTRQLRMPITAGAQTNDLAIGEKLVVDLEAVAGPHEVLLPPADTANAGQSISIKIFGPATGQTLTLTPDGTDVLDKTAVTRTMTADREFITFSIRLGGGGWLEGSE